VEDQQVAVVKFRINNRSGDGTSSFEVKIRTTFRKISIGENAEAE